MEKKPEPQSEASVESEPAPTLKKRTLKNLVSRPRNDDKIVGGSSGRAALPKIQGR